MNKWTSGFPILLLWSQLRYVSWAQTLLYWPICLQLQQRTIFLAADCCRSLRFCCPRSNQCMSPRSCCCSLRSSSSIRKKSVLLALSLMCWVAPKSSQLPASWGLFGAGWTMAVVLHLSESPWACSMVKSIALPKVTDNPLSDSSLRCCSSLSPLVVRL